MSKYVEVTVVTDGDKVNKLISEGWEIISTNNYVIEPPDARTQYHMGLPAQVLVEELRGLIRKYEEFGFKDELFKKVAEQNEENLDDYGTGTGRYTIDKTPKFMSKYEKLVNNRNVEYLRKLGDDWA